MRRCTFRPFSVLALALPFAIPTLADPGFGSIRKKTIDLQVRQPALVRLANTSVAFTGKVANPEYSAGFG